MQKITLRLIQEIQKQVSINIILVLAEKKGEYLTKLPPEIEIIDLQVSYDFRLKTIFKLFFPLVNCLNTYKPDVILSTLPCFNFLTIIAWLISGKKGHLVLGEHTLPLNRLLEVEGKSSGLIGKLVKFLSSLFYPYADNVIGVSNGITKELQKTLRLPKQKLQTIYNPVVNNDLLEKSYQPINHPWFEKNQPPIFLAIGRLTQQKDYPTLLSAFAQVCQIKSVRLLIFGEGEKRSQLEGLIKQLNLENYIQMPGFTENPYAFLSQSSALILSSIWEVLPTVLIEALACGCPVIATDCNYGPREILADGLYGNLIPVGDVDALAETMLNNLEQKEDRQRLKNYAQKFNVEESVSKYMKVLQLVK
ncbi:MAG: glycosyltransferase [Trichodesmium sp. MAG_R04]|nr:glycosyltransferase [Trichodesmium sp. MAG_R04]